MSVKSPATQLIGAICCLVAGFGIGAVLIGSDFEANFMARNQIALSVAGQSRYGLKVISRSQNMGCEVLQDAGVSVLVLAPPADQDRQMAVVSPTKGWMFPAGRSYSMRAGISKTLYFNPESQLAILGGKPASFDQGDGQYEIVFSDAFEIDVEDIDPQAWCKFLIWRKDAGSGD